MPRGFVYTLWSLAKDVSRRWRANDGDALAASLAYYAALSFFPLLLVLISALGFVLRLSAGARQALLDLLAKSASPVLSDSIGRVLSDVQSGASVTGPLGLLLMIAGAIGVFARLDAAVNRFWRGVVPRSRGPLGVLRRVLVYRLRAFLLLMALGGLIAATLLAGVALAAVRSAASELPAARTTWHVVEMTLGVASNALVFTLLYKVMPQAPVQWRHALACGGAVAAAWEVARQIVSVLVVRGNYTAYGVVGSFIAVLLWVYFASSLVLLGAQTVQVLGHPVEPTARPDAA